MNYDCFTPHLNCPVEEMVMPTTPKKKAAGPVRAAGKPKAKATPRTARPKQLSGDVYYPSKEVIAQAYVKDPEVLYRKASKDLAGFWNEHAKALDWYKPWTKTLDDSKKPFY